MFTTEAQRAQRLMKSLAELINMADPAWPIVQEWLKNANKTVELLPVEKTKGEETILKLQITTRSLLGAIALETGGILFDNGWLRVLGTSCDQMKGDLLSWNGLANGNSILSLKDGLIVAQDVIGGGFALNGGAFQGKLDDVFFLSPDTLQWENLDKSYSDFIYWAAVGNFEQFYENSRWTGWENEVATLNGDEGFSIYPPLWATGGPVSERSRKIVSMKELWELNSQF